MAVDALKPTLIDAPDNLSDPVYYAEDHRRATVALLTGGATAALSQSGVLDPRALVPSLSANKVQLTAGPAAISSPKGTYLTGASATLTDASTLQAADATNPRRDRIVLEILDPDNGGSAGRKSQLRVIPGTPSPTALSGGGYPAEPPLALTIGWVDVPKSGGGSPSVTDMRPFTAAAGAPVPVRTKAEQDALPKWDGALCARNDLGGSVMRCNGTTWIALGTANHAEFRGPLVATSAGIGTNPGVLVLDSPNSKDSAFVTPNGAGVLKVLVAGVYVGGMVVSPSTNPGASSKAIISANGEVIGTDPGSSYGGNQFGSNMVPKYLAANTLISYTLVTTNAVNIGSLVTITRIG